MSGMRGRGASGALPVGEALLNHLALPPQLPQRQDADLEKLEVALVERLITASQTMREVTANPAKAYWDSVCRSLSTRNSFTVGSRLERSSLLAELRQVAGTDFLVLYIRNQNAGVFIQRSTTDSDSVVIEVFEASPRCEDVLAADNALQWNFPGSAAALPSSRFFDESFLTCLASFFEQASLESTKSFAAHTSKAGSSITETRDTADPSLVSSMLIALLEGNGQRVNTPVLRKRVRDDVCWDNAEMPWRRLPLWLVFRVVIQRFLALRLGGEVGRAQYKFFICVVLMNLMNEVMHDTSIDRLSHLRGKLCSRLGKLEVDYVNASTYTRFDYDSLFANLNPQFRDSISKAANCVNDPWERFKESTTRRVLPLPRRVERHEMQLSLRISGDHLRRSLERFRAGTASSTPSRAASGQKDANTGPSRISEPYFRLAGQEETLRRLCEAYSPGRLSDSSSADRCVILSKAIRDYLGDVGTRYDRDPEQKSVFLLTIMELWMRLDEAACSLYPLLRDYHPYFSASMLDVLHLTQFTDMVRLRTVQNYLRMRAEGCNDLRLTIFADPCRGCFAERFFDESPEAPQLQALLDRIEDIAERTRVEKEKEWKTKSQEYERLTKMINDGSCVYLEDANNPLGRGIHDRRCPRCKLQQAAQRMKMQIFEHPLPTEQRMKKVVAFELGRSRPFETYRDMTWYLIARLACSVREDCLEPKCTLPAYSELCSFAKGPGSSLVLASTTKSFLNTHYATVSFPVEWDNVCRPNGLRFGYYDTETASWPGRKKLHLTFAHHCSLELPPTSPLRLLADSVVAEGPGLSSYEIIASQTACPPGVNVHEYTAFQTLASGKARRWITLLTELGSSNLNFSSEATAILVSHLIHECGPQGSPGDPLRLTHGIFRDFSFCEKLMEQLTLRLDNLVGNWREVHLMDILISIALRLYFLTEVQDLSISRMSPKALAFLGKARKITLSWMTLLREEASRASDMETAGRYQIYTLWACVLCKRTFSIHKDQSVALDVESLRIYIECSITLHSNLLRNPEALPWRLRNAIVRDFKLIWGLQRLLRVSIKSRPDAFMLALNSLWPEPDGTIREVLSSHLDETASCLTTVVAAADAASRQQTIAYNFLHGLLLVDGMPLGQLPPEYQRSPILTQLFGEQSLLTYPSRLRGMTHTLNIKPLRYEVHIGFQGRDMLVWAYKGGATLQLVSREIFRTPGSFDLPETLLTGCFHWLNLRTGMMEIRRKPWIKSRGNWVLDVHTGQCSRVRGQNTDHFVDPYMPLCHRVARIFEDFEPRQQIEVFQRTERSRPPRLFVALPRLQLTFYVNHKHVLESFQLHAEVDQDQDAGTWYGLLSKLVFRGTRSSERMILVPLGDLETERRGSHTVIRVRANGAYGKFVIDDIVGRVQCAAEPTLIYKKAQLHAYTSSVVPDPLTRKTGTEEALSWLSSGACQPWTPLRSVSVLILDTIARLTPSRKYYPEDMKVMKVEKWDRQLTVTIQHEAFRGVVDRIISTSDNLYQFSLQPTGVELQNSGRKLLEPVDYHLNQRAWLRRQSYQRAMPYARPTPVPTVDREYVSRDHSSALKRSYANVLEIVSLIRTGPAKIDTEPNLSRSLASSPTIGGYSEAYDKVLLSDRLDVDVRREWGGLAKLAREHGEDRYSLMFLFAPMSFRFDSDMALLRSLVAFGIFDELKQLALPPWPEYHHFQPNQIPRLDYLVQLMRPFRNPPPEDDRHSLQEFMSSKELRKMREAKLKHEKASEEDCKKLAQFLLDQWPCAKLEVDGRPTPLLLDVEAALQVVRPEWERLFQNMQLFDHLVTVQGIFDRRRTGERFRPPEFLPSAELFSCRLRCPHIPELADNLTRKAGPRRNTDTLPPTVPKHGVLAGSWAGVASASSQSFVFGQPARFSSFNPGDLRMSPKWPNRDAETQQAITELRGIVDKFAASKSSVRQRYGSELQQSLESFTTRRIDSRDSQVGAQEDQARHLEEVKRCLETIRVALESPTASCSARHIRWLRGGLLWPAVTPTTVLELLKSTTECSFGKGMREAIIEYGVAITKLQRARRLDELRTDPVRYREEQMNRGHTNWSPDDYPDWLLLEIEANLLIRPDQVDVARAIIRPTGDTNSVLQMNMGQGKTSCVIPMAALILANGRQLARIVVPKALLQQTGQLLQSRIGGLLNRQIRHVPFARRTPTKESQIRLYRSMHQEIQQESGVMLCLPEHNLSFMLSGLQRLLDNQIPEAAMMIKTQSWLNLVCRDVLDESDYTLAVRTQLIYPSGEQMAVDGHPHRWKVAEAILKLVDLHLHDLQVSFSRSIEVVRRPNGGFPLIFFLRTDVEEELVRRLTLDICRGNGGILPMSTLDGKLRAAIKEFISVAKVRQTTVETIRTMCPDKVHLRQIVYLLRGFLVNRILMMTLKKRWNVQYGLHPGRDPIAVPFHAKGVPSEQSEWGHPDVAILFTCLAFYYDGVNLGQAKQSLEHVLKSDDPSSEYDRWTQSCENFPDSLREWNAINIEDEAQLEEIWKSVRYNIVVIDYFLNNFVFPRHARQFKVKLQSNGWDIPVFDSSTPPAAAGPSGRRTKKALPSSLTTGFSGTNDNRSMLPLTIKQQDLPGLSHTNAEVLTYLLHQRNRRYMVMSARGQRRLSEEDFLEMLRRNGIKILIDAGAQILEMDNYTLARTWLDIDYRAPAALYFDEGSKPWIVTRQGASKTPLIASTFAEDLSQCLVYIDQAHTRGTDLKLPTHACGALTLGLGQTKDHTVQAAMRLRQLASTQRVVFFAPPEVNQSILDLQRKASSIQIDSHDVITWLLSNTCDGIEELQPLFYSQGIDFCKRMQAAANNPDFLNDRGAREKYIAAIRQDEQKTLQQLYEPKLKARATAVEGVADRRIAGFVRELNTRRRAFQDRGHAVHGSALQEVEQEREVAFEVESVRQVKKPLQHAAWSWPGLHRDLEAFARTGRLPADSSAFHHALVVMGRTTLGRKFGISKEASQSRLFVSSEFEKTAKINVVPTNDNFLRPVNWILWSEAAQCAIVVIPEEAEKLLDIVRYARGSPTFLLTYAAPITRKMLHFNRLNYFSIPALPKDWEAPAWLTTELGIFAGRLYFEWAEYAAVCRFLGVDEAVVIDDDDVDDGEMGEDDLAVKLELSALSLEGAGDGGGGCGGGDVDCANGKSDGVATAVQNGGQSRPKTARRFTAKPLQFMQEWLAVRRRGQDFVQTPMGYITQGKVLDETHSFFRRVEAEDVALADQLLAPITKRVAREAADDEGDEDGADDLICGNAVDEEASDGGISDQEIEYDEEEMYSSVEEEEAHVHGHPSKGGRRR